MSPSVNVAPGALLVLAILVIGLVVLFAKLRGRGRVALGLIVLVALAAGLFAYRMVTQRASVVHGGSSAVPLISADSYRSTTIGDPWPVEADPKFKPDVYPSTSSAVRGVASDLAAHLSKLVTDGNRLETVRLSGEVDRPVLDIVAIALGDVRPGLRVVTGDTMPRSPSRGEGTVNVRVSVAPTAVEQTQNGRPREVSGGKVEMEATHATGRFLRSVSFVEKPWVDSFAEFASRDPRQRWIVGRSPGPQSSPSDAELAAIRAAARALLPEACIDAGSPRLVTYVQSGSHPEVRQQLERIIERQLLDRQYVVDRFVQSFQRPYGRVWSATVLVDASPAKLKTLAAALRRHHSAERQAWVHTALSVGGLILLICLVYLFLNAATKGYYVWMLRLGALAVVAVGVAAVLLVA